MPKKKTKAGRDYRVDGKQFIWTTEEGDEVTIPLRVKLKVLRAVSDKDMDIDGMFATLELLVPDQTAVLDEMDVNDFGDMFVTWQNEYESLSGASLGESQGSSS